MKELLTHGLGTCQLINHIIIYKTVCLYGLLDECWFFAYNMRVSVACLASRLYFSCLVVIYTNATLVFLIFNCVVLANQITKVDISFSKICGVSAMNIWMWIAKLPFLFLLQNVYMRNSKNKQQLLKKYVIYNVETITNIVKISICIIENKIVACSILQTLMHKIAVKL